jgi:outer membrane protein
MRNSLIITAVAVGLAAMAASAQPMAISAQLKIGYISSEEIFAKYKCAKDAEEKLKKELDNAEKEILADKNRREKELMELNNTIEKQGAMLSQQAKKELIDSLRLKAQQSESQLQELYKKKQDETLVRRTELLKPIEDTINRIIKKIARNGNYDFVLDAVTGRILFASPQYDLTDSVVALLPSCLEQKKAGSAKKKNK